MLKSLITVFAFLSFYNSYAIVGGERVSKNDPLSSSTYAILEKEQKIVCSGSFISKRKFISAAHCLIWEKDLNSIKLKDKDFSNEEEYLYQAKKEITEKIKRMSSHYSLLKTDGTNEGMFKKKKMGILLSGNTILLTKSYMQYLAYKIALNNESQLVIQPKKNILTGLKENDKSIVIFSRDISVTPITLLSQNELEQELENDANKIISLGFGVTNKGSVNYNDKSKGHLKKLALKKFKFDESSLEVSGIKEFEGLCYSDSGGATFLQKPNGEIFQIGINRSIVAGGCALSNDMANSFITLVNSENIESDF